MTKPLRYFVFTGALLAACSDQSPQGAAEDLGVDAATAQPDLAPPPPHYDWVGIVGTGQSLSVGYAAGTVVGKTQPFHNLKLFDSGADPKYPLDGTGTLSLVPLVELIRPRLTGYADDQYPNNIYGETPHSALANQLSALAAATWSRDYVTIHSVVGWSGHPIGDIDKVGGKRAYPGDAHGGASDQEAGRRRGQDFRLRRDHPDARGDRLPERQLRRRGLSAL